MKRWILFCAFISALAGAYPAVTHAAPDESEAGGGKSLSGLPLPRFASLRSNEVNMRTGPGTRYPIDWVLTRQGLPVEIIAEYEIWRRIREPDGAEGWVHKNALSGKRMAIVTGSTRELRQESSMQAPIVAHLETGATGQVLSCAEEWCRIKFDRTKGYLHKTNFWGAYPSEIFD